MELKFESIQELEKFIERLGYVKKEETKEKEDKEQPSENGNVTLTIKECPYGFVYCPYNRKIDPYSPTYPLYCNQSTTGDIQNDGYSITAKNSVNVKDLSKDNNI